MSAKYQLWVSAAWVALCLLRLSGTWADTLWFLFDVEKLDPRALPEFDSHRVWMASHGSWWFFGLLLFSVLFLQALYRMFKVRSISPHKPMAEPSD
jgi:quinol-cytochrome oxidoreductase complex cytochrome b subunit